MDILGFDAVDFIKNECNDVQFAGEMHDALKLWVGLNGTSVTPKEELTDDEFNSDPVSQKAMNYFVPMEDVKHEDEVVRTFCEKMKELSEKENEKHLFLKFEDFNIAVYQYGIGIFDKDFGMVCFVGDAIYEPDIEPIVADFVIKGHGYWEAHENSIKRLLSNGDFIDAIFDVWQKEYSPVNLGSLS